jgi:hypothetical protein
LFSLISHDLQFAYASSFAAVHALYLCGVALHTLAALQAYFRHENLKIYCMHFGSEILCCEVCFKATVINHSVTEVKSLACVGLLVY